jgi:hypothetical protein
MAIELKVYDKRPVEVMEIVQELREQGYIQGADFDFEYHAPVQDTFGHEPPTRRYTIFTFYTEKYATLFALKYGN